MTQPGPHFDEMDGVTLTGHEIYRRIHAGPGATSLTLASDAMETLARRYEQRATRVIALSDRMNAAWQGSTSDAAQSHMPALVRLHQDSQKVLDTVRAALKQQAEQYGETRVKLEDIPETKPVNRMYNPEELSADIAQAAAEYNAKAHHNISVYDQYVTQSHTNGRAIGDTPYPTAFTIAPTSVTVRSASGTEASGWSAGPGYASSAHSAALGSGAGGGVSVDLPPTQSRPGMTLPSGGGVPPGGGVAPPGGVVPPGGGSVPAGNTAGTATTPQGWGPDPALARHWIAEGEPPRQPGGQGSVALGGYGSRSGGLDRDDRRPGVAPRAGAVEPVVSRSVLRGAPPAGAGGSALGNGMLGSPMSSGKDDDAEHTSKLDGYVDLDKMFTPDGPAFPAVIGAETDEDEEDER